MYRIKGRHRFNDTQKNVASKIGISPEHLSKVMNGHRCSKMVAHCITHELNEKGKIEDFFEII